MRKNNYFIMKLNRMAINSKIFLTFVLIVLAAFPVSAQDTSNTKQNDKCKVVISPGRIMNVEFMPQAKSSNLLVILVDNFGNTVFLDSQHDLKGSYKHEIDLSRSGKGDYYLKIVSDHEIVNKKLNIQ